MENKDWYFLDSSGQNSPDIFRNLQEQYLPEFSKWIKKFFPDTNPEKILKLLSESLVFAYRQLQQER